MPRNYRTRRDTRNIFPIKAVDISAFRDRKRYEVTYSDGSTRIVNRQPKITRASEHDYMIKINLAYDEDEIGAIENEIQNDEELTTPQRVRLYQRSLGRMGELAEEEEEREDEADESNYGEGWA